MIWEITLLGVTHLLLAVLWVGGMLFARVCLAPASGELDPAARLALWRRVLSRFFVLVGVAVVGLPLTGYRLGYLQFGGIAGYPLYVDIMHGLGWLMIALFVYLVVAPWRQLNRTLAADDLPGAAQALGRIRRIVSLNLVLGLVVIVAAGSGRFLPF